MIYISHRGNINGKNEERENSPSYITEALAMGFDVEVDIWSVDGKVWLGHDKPQYRTTLQWLNERIGKLWIHCKNIEAIEFANWFKGNNRLNYFWHEKDTVTLTSQGFIWAYPGKQPIVGSIAVLPEVYNDDVSTCIGVCSDYISHFSRKKS